jgi:undecaprenyl diphosphate synthase
MAAGPRPEGCRAAPGTRPAPKPRGKSSGNAAQLGIPFLTLYTFSKENWSRPKQEVGFLFDLLKEFLSAELPSLLEQSIRLNVLGEMDELPLPTRQVLRHAMGKTADARA